MSARDLRPSIASIPPGAWAVGVSGGADSVALLRLAKQRTDLKLHVVHLDHQLRGEASDEDARFVSVLAEQLELPATIATREQIEGSVKNDAVRLPANPSARYRALRLRLFREVILREGLLGVLLAHHADDQAETVLLRLLRGSGPMGMVGMSETAEVAGVCVLRPLLHVRGAQLRAWLRESGQAWREDASNRSAKQKRNCVRQWLAANPTCVENLLTLQRACSKYANWVRAAQPALAEEFLAAELHGPRVLAREAARQWLIARGSPAEELTPMVLDRLRLMAIDAATPPAAEFPGKRRVRRAGGECF